jgi:hypothetical protein
MESGRLCAIGPNTLKNREIRRKIYVYPLCNYFMRTYGPVKLPLFLEMLLTMNEHKGQWDKKNFTKRTY